jgi:hypothetical protein
MEAMNMPLMTPVHGKKESSAAWKKCMKSSWMRPQDLTTGATI